MIWSKTDAGRLEMQSRSLVKERVRRNLLLLIDGLKSEAMLLSSIDGVTRADLDALAGLGLIAPLGGAGAVGSASTGSEAAASATDPQDHAG